MASPDTRKYSEELEMRILADFGPDAIFANFGKLILETMDEGMYVADLIETARIHAQGFVFIDEIVSEVKNALDQSTPSEQHTKIVETLHYTQKISTRLQALIEDVDEEYAKFSGIEGQA